MNITKTHLSLGAFSFLYGLFFFEGVFIGG